LGNGGIAAHSAAISSLMKTNPDLIIVDDLEQSQKENIMTLNSIRDFIPDLTPSGYMIAPGSPFYSPTKSQKIKRKRLLAHNQRCKRKKR
jgi:hypothetical protein